MWENFNLSTRKTAIFGKVMERYQKKPRKNRKIRIIIAVRFPLCNLEILTRMTKTSIETSCICTNVTHNAP